MRKPAEINTSHESMKHVLGTRQQRARERERESFSLLSNGKRFPCLQSFVADL